MANILGILGGAGQGISAGVQDLERMDEAKNRKEEAQFRKEQQQRERERFAEEKRIGELQKGIVRNREGFTPEQAAANTQAGFINLPTRDDEGRLVYGATSTPRAQSEVLKEQAALMASSTNPDIQARGIQMLGTAGQLGEQERTQGLRTKREETLTKYRPFAQAIMASPQGAFDYLDKTGTSYYNQKVPDGQMVSQPVIGANGERTYYVLDQNKAPVKSFVVTPQQAQEAAAKQLQAQISHELGTISSEDYLSKLERDLKERQVGATETSAGASMLNAQTQQAYQAPGGVWDQAQKAARDAQIQVAKINKSTVGILNPLQAAQLSELTNYQQLTQKFAKLMDDPKTNAAELKKVAGILATTHPEKSTATIKIRDADGNEEPVTINKYGYLVKEALRGAGVVEIHPSDDAKLKSAATAAKNDPTKFLKTPAAQQAMKAGVTQEELLASYVKPKK
jgi:hypothetical protein